MINIKTGILFTFLFFLSVKAGLLAQETFQPIENGKAPETYEELWANFDPQKEPLDTEILHQWEEDGVILQVLRYRIGIFKGQKAMMAAVYGYPKGATNLPGLVQIHGGGQYADYRAILTNAKRGYATISISWAGRINAPDYKVTPDIVKLFWVGDTSNPNYKITTDWGPLDAYHAPHRNKENSSAYVKPQAWTLDEIESPRNNLWFLCTVGAKRALTFLEEQPQVNPEKLGVYGHSMGGKITVLTATDKRVKAAAPSCGGISNNDNENGLYQKTIADNVYLKEITCPIIFLSPSNDFHGHFGDLPKAVSLIQTDDWRVISSPHHSHQDNGESEVTALLWFDQYLKGTFNYPKSPETKLELNTKNRIPSFSVIPDQSKIILDVDIYYTQQGENPCDRNKRVNRFWHYAKAVKKENSWSADLPLGDTEKPLWAYANIRYQLDVPVIGAGYYYRVYTTETFNISSVMKVVTQEQLNAEEVRKTMNPSSLIETFEGDWQKEWFAYKPDKWELKTHKLYSEIWSAPENAKLVFEICCNEANKMVVGIDNYAKEIVLKGGNKWQQIVLLTSDFTNSGGENLEDWSGIKEFRFSATESFKTNADGEYERTVLGGKWKGEKPKFRNMHWTID